MKPAFFLITALSLLLSATAAEASVELTPCHLSAPHTPARVAAECGRLTVAENPAAPEGKQIELAIAVLPATTRRRVADPLFFITGGPGQSALESFVTARGAFGRINRSRDIVLVDQRGTGKSNQLSCPQVEALDTALLEESAQLEAITACLEELPGDPRFYTTSVAIRDLEAVRRALGYEHVNLYGISYGSRVAQAYARKYPDRVRSVILDGVVPMDLALGPGISVDAQRALEMMFARCAADTDCAERFPALRESFERLRRQLAEAPVQLVLADPTTGELSEHVFTEEYFRGVIRMFSYAPETVSLLPLLIDHSTQTGDFVPLAAQAVLVSKQMGESMAIGMHNAVVCTEDLPFVDDSDVLREDLLGTYLGASTLDFLKAACSVWPIGVMDADFKSAWRSDLPTLLLSGEADPVTPPEYGEQVLESLPNGLHLVGPDQGHGMYMRGCVPRIMESFISSGSVVGLDTDCISSIRPMPFFLRFTGPNP